jgi:hypothetical protein
MLRGGKRAGAGRKSGRALPAEQRVLIGSICHKKLERITRDHLNSLLETRDNQPEVRHEQERARQAIAKLRVHGSQGAEEFKETIEGVSEALDEEGRERKHTGLPRVYTAMMCRAPNGAREQAYAETIAEYRELSGRTIRREAVIEYLKEWRRLLKRL